MQNTDAYESNEITTLLKNDRLSFNTENESVLTIREMDELQKAPRTQTTIAAEANLYKMMIGIALVAFPYSMSWVGIGAATLGICILAVISLISSYLLFKARNKYKDKVIVDLADLAFVCYGPKMRILCEVILVTCQISIMMAYLIYLGTQSILISNQLGFEGNKIVRGSFICSIIMMPAYLLREFSSLSYFSGVFTLFSCIAIIVICSYDCVMIHNQKKPTEVKVFDWAQFPLFLGQSIVLFECNVSLLNVYAEHG